MQGSSHGKTCTSGSKPCATGMGMGWGFCTGNPYGVGCLQKCQGAGYQGFPLSSLKTYWHLCILYKPKNYFTRPIIFAFIFSTCFCVVQQPCFCLGQPTAYQPSSTPFRGLVPTIRASLPRHLAHQPFLTPFWDPVYYSPCTPSHPVPCHTAAAGPPCCG